MVHQNLLCGIDEVGRGPLAGPVVAAALVLPQDFPIELLADSKTLKESKREELFPLILDQCLDYGFGWVWAWEIDLLNIHYASLEAMARAFSALTILPEITLVDGKFCPEIPGKTEAVIQGDSKVAAIAGASILAKVVRDRWMERMDWIDPRYGFGRHKGYPTAAHKKALAEHGPGVLHRKSFRLFPSPALGKL